jgi:hypothetical protein
MHMRPLRFLLLLVLVVLAASAFTASAPADDDDDDDGSSSPALVDFTFGSGTADFGLSPPFVLSTFSFDVQSGPNGEAATGFATLTDVRGNLYIGPATCLNVQGMRAVFEVANTLGDHVRVFVGDFGVGMNIDEFNFDLIAQADATCPDVGDRENSVVAGDIVVRDNAPPRRGGDDDDDDGEDGEDGDD